MRKVLSLIIGLVFISTWVWADVTGEIIGEGLDGDSKILIKVQYKIDGVELKTNTLYQGKYCYVFRYNMLDLINLSTIERKQKILKNVEFYARQLIKKEFLKKASLEFKNTDINLLNLIGSKISVLNATIEIDKNKSWVVKSDGTKVKN